MRLVISKSPYSVGDVTYSAKETVIHISPAASLFDGKLPTRRELALVLAHEIGHTKTDDGKAGNENFAAVQQREITASLAAMFMRRSRTGIHIYARALQGYHVKQPLALLRAGCDRLGIPKRTHASFDRANKLR